ncbi:hypothetical protein JQ557_08870 [Bradyrhizobium sp. U87765 SZCCT0131]|uniref:hypothetical protein n=1 Tax=unclassified Bradyrhizobium TaxID=2631580 RepID=UPI001BA9AFF8|nr:MULTISPECIES: hypothetical protein [unclassified Bradyrhizobium]MBR1218095.1 hypothetical protein [Bradyrhizobium sp. U87765 SZCCT0131]MBR1260959.1 hypothetical protein [Bradyrhizobium sp. U87765 SZCCT0134]MBR1303593.1 hypothetical protein [Bradyrhizobium sp. U87765 SZCCT0110]MBR1319199.1 hypothetical protein [Bradyrhizobium sp. U87765 SZCCT0109]MBR1347524.1 hypothetical protein [Bradyrhizobium sp. U87765 SZCCT0048]
MKRMILALAALLGPAVVTQAVAAPAPVCTVAVLQADELPYAPFGTWLVKATLQITPQSGVRYQTTLFEALPWHKTLRRGDRFGIRCDRFQPETLRLSDLVR